MQRLLAEHKETMSKMLESMEQEKSRQVDRLKEEIQRRRERKEQKRREQFEAEEALAVREDEEEEQRGMDQVNSEEAKQLQTKLARTRRPSTPVTKTTPPAPPRSAELEPEKPVKQDLPVVRQDSLTTPDKVLQNASLDINKLIMDMPFFSQISEIESLLQFQLVSNGSPPFCNNHTPYIDVQDAQWECKGQIVSTDIQSRKPADFLVYRFGVYASQVFHIKNQLPEIPIQIASNLPPNNYTNNCFRNSFFYDHPGGILFIREERLASIGEFAVLVLHCLCHIKCGDLTDDSQPVFLREFYSGMKTLCQELFLSRVIQPPEDGGNSLANIVERMPSWDKPEEAVKELINLELPLQSNLKEASESFSAEKRPSYGGNALLGVAVPDTSWNNTNEL